MVTKKNKARQNVRGWWGGHEKMRFPADGFQQRPEWGERASHIDTWGRDARLRRQPVQRPGAGNVLCVPGAARRSVWLRGEKEGKSCSIRFVFSKDPSGRWVENEPGAKGRPERHHCSWLFTGICDLVDWPMFTFHFINLNYIIIVISSSKHSSPCGVVLTFSVSIFYLIIFNDCF